MYRLFVAIDPPDDIKRSLMDICFGVPGARWTDETRMHVTLRFIGEVDGGVFEDAREALATVQFEPFEMTVKGLGFFPPRKAPETLWAGVEGNDKLVQLRNRVESALGRAGLARESRKFAPHIVLAKIKETPPGRLAGFLGQHALLKFPPFTVEEFHLYSSHLSSERALHTIEESYHHTAHGSARL